MMTYTLSPVHTDAYYVERTRELVALAVDPISIKDPTGLLTPERGRTLFPMVVQAAGARPVQLHSHCQVRTCSGCLRDCDQERIPLRLYRNATVSQRCFAAGNRGNCGPGAQARSRHIDERRCAR